MGDDAVEIDAEDHEEIVERVAAIDVAKATAMVCTRVPHPSKPGKRLTKVWNTSATTNAIMALSDDLAGLGIERVVVESTSDYWRPFVYLLQARGSAPGWSTPGTTSRSRAARRPTSSMRCGWPSSTSGAC